MHRLTCLLLFSCVVAWVSDGVFAVDAAPVAAKHTKSARPNVILIMADDLGYNDLSCYGSDRLRTPTLDKMAEQGVRLTSFYAGATVCTPSRMALLSGSYPVRVGWSGGVLGYGMKGNTGLSRDVVTIAEVFKAAGYRTGISGKWHVGQGDLLPMHQGFDETFYVVSSNNLTKKLWRGDKLVANPFDNRKLSEHFTAEAIRFIEASQKESAQTKPFFLYMPYTAPHFPAEAHPDWKDRSKNGAYGDVVEELDSRVGEVLDALKKHGLDENTLVIFTSDNGPEPGQRKFASAKPYSGLKWSALEGGVRVPCIVRWPGVVKPGRTSDAITSAIDLMPTLAAACGIEVKLPDGAQPIDGVNVWPTFRDDDASHARKDLLYWQGWGVAQAIRVGDWKLHFAHDKKLPGSQGAQPGSEKGPLLFNLKQDPAERENLSAKHPDKVEQLLAVARQRVEAVYARVLPLGPTTGGEKAQAKIAKPKRKVGKWLDAETTER